MLVYSKLHMQSTAQVKGSAKKMVTVVATRELKAGDVLRRFKGEAAQDEPRRGNNNNRYIVVGVVAVGVWKVVAAHGILFTCVLCFSYFFHWYMCVMMMICTAFLVMVTALACC